MLAITTDAAVWTSIAAVVIALSTLVAMEIRGRHSADASYVVRLERRVHELEEENARLENRVKDLQDEVMYLHRVAVGYKGGEAT